MSDNLPPLPELPFLPHYSMDRVLMVRWATEYGQACAMAERERCAQVCETLERESGYAGKELEQAAAAIRKG